MKRLQEIVATWAASGKHNRHCQEPIHGRCTVAPDNEPCDRTRLEYNGQNLVAILCGNFMPLHGRLTCRFSQSQLVRQITFTYAANTSITVYRKIRCLYPVVAIDYAFCKERDCFLYPTPITQLTTSKV